MPSKNPGAHDPEDIKKAMQAPVAGGDGSPARKIRDDGTLDDPPPMPAKQRKRRVRLITRRYVIVLAVSIALVVTAVVGLAIGGDNQTGRTVLFTGIGLIGAVVALASTVWRAKVGDDLDEAKL